jgi:hypothetical protein
MEALLKWLLYNGKSYLNGWFIMEKHGKSYKKGWFLLENPIKMDDLGGIPMT